jgi:hypothetical protein
MANYDCYQATIPAGLESVSVVVRPFDDDVIENIELLEIELLPDVMATSTVPARYVVAANPSVSSSLFIGPIELSQMQLTAADPAKAVVTLNDTEVAKVEWVGTDGGDGKSNLEATEENGGGFRLFPDKNSPGEAGKTHRKFKAKITLSAPIPDETLKTVYVKIFDVDDPTESASDTNDSANGTIQRGNDNVGANGGLVSSEMVEIKVTPGQTSVEVEYTLSDVSPGNNFKVFATTHAALANDVEIDTAVGNGLSRENAFRKASDHSVKPDPKDSTSLLSIWRRLNVEIDRMGGIVRDHASSTFPLEADLVDALNRLTTDGGENRTLVTIGGDRPMESWQRDAFTGGNLIIDDIAYPILLSTDQHFGVKGHVPDTAIGKEWIAYDDDATTFPGVDAGQVPWPDIGALNKAFNKAYIQVEVVESAKSADTTFRSNVEKTAYEEVIREKKTLVTEDDYWTITALGAFQGPKLADGDGLDDNATLLFGFAPALKEDDFTGLNGIIMFAETLRDVAAQMTYATEDAHAAALKSMSERWVVHEVAHAFGLRHESGGIMAYLQSTPEAWSEATGMQMVFSRQQLEQLRSSDAMERIGSDSK